MTMDKDGHFLTINVHTKAKSEQLLSGSIMDITACGVPKRILRRVR